MSVKYPLWITKPGMTIVTSPVLLRMMNSYPKALCQRGKKCKKHFRRDLRYHLMKLNQAWSNFWMGSLSDKGTAGLIEWEAEILPRYGREADIQNIIFTDRDLINVTGKSAYKVCPLSIRQCNAIACRITFRAEAITWYW